MKGYFVCIKEVFLSLPSKGVSSKNKHMLLVLQGCKLIHFELMVCRVLEKSKAGIPVMQNILDATK